MDLYHFKHWRIDMLTEEEILYKKIRTRRETIIKNGTYTIGPEQPESIMMINGITVNRTEDVLQGNIDAMVKNQNDIEERKKAEEENMIAEIMNKFQSNIQNNVSSLFDNL